MWTGPVPSPTYHRCPFLADPDVCYVAVLRPALFLAPRVSCSSEIDAPCESVRPHLSHWCRFRSVAHPARTGVRMDGGRNRRARLYSRPQSQPIDQSTVSRRINLLRGGVIGNSPGSGPGIQGSSPCPAASRSRLRVERLVRARGSRTSGPDVVVSGSRAQIELRSLETSARSPSRSRTLVPETRSRRACSRSSERPTDRAALTRPSCT
jgi:hypothetical protein